MSEASKEVAMTANRYEEDEDEDGSLSFDTSITDKAHLSALLDSIAKVIKYYGIDKVGCFVHDEKDRVDISIVCVKPGADIPEHIWRPLVPE